MHFLLAYLTIVNIVSFGIMGYDKSQAGSGGMRVPEKRIFALSLVGGALGTWLGMRTFNHKTKHLSFIVGIPALLLMNIVCICLLITKLLKPG
ncbi:putative membrane protein (plasmid) [Thermobacillus composti KWC4]|jgi:uncharacterized membrane protein YsdA (DUF1294 family)|uniref:Putative membrane protein n=1 Tax=Thermobacillus composti (strain DSM 18247 / JCM 13945 / KWC4) TaxID=717605 RepID=L0EJS8_THECK|nr:DUF1294 domain-containing protein [Thermobacillus composti]AGA60041.1 putative membrane protein [Thermobacillus composti KWC4]